MKTISSRLLLAGLLAAATAVHAESGRLSDAERDAMQQRIEATAKSDREACEPLHGNKQDVCELQAKWRERIARAELEFRHSGSDADRANVVDVKAEAEFEIERERCEDRPANSQEACKRQAQTRQTGMERRKPGY